MDATVILYSKEQWLLSVI